LGWAKICVLCPEHLNLFIWPWACQQSYNILLQYFASIQRAVFKGGQAETLSLGRNFESSKTLWV
jgi:hypothetical protein